MTQEIAVIGSPEFTTGFRLAGVRIFENVQEPDKPDELDNAVARIHDHSDVAIAIMHDGDLPHLSRTARETVETSVDPTFVVIGGGAAGGMREKIKRAIGIDLMNQE